MPVIPSAEFFDIAGVRTYCLRAGKGPAVILLHGLGASSYSWRRLLPDLADANAVYAVDLPGFGRSDKPLDFDYSFAGFSKWVIALMDHFGLERASLVGNSMGGVIAVRTAMEHSERVERLVLLGTPAYPHNRPQIIFTLRWPLVGRLVERLLGPWAVAVVAPTAFFDKKHVTPELLAEYGLSLKHPGGRRAVVQFVRGAVPPDAQAWIARYPGIQQPTLVVRGEHDTVLDRASAERFVKALPRARFLSIPACGHAAQEERPDIVVPALLEFLGARA